MQEFVIAPAGMKPLWILVPVAIALGLVVAILSGSVLASNRARFELSAEGLRISGDLYGRLIPPASLRIDEARRVDPAVSAELRPARRTLGGAFPGYQSGWFRLANREKALLYLTDRRKAVYIPTTEGYSVLISPNDPDGFLSALRSSRGM